MWERGLELRAMFRDNHRIYTLRYVLFFLLLFVLVACERPSIDSQFALVNPPQVAAADGVATPTLAATTVAVIEQSPTETAVVPTNTPIFTPTPFYTGALSPPCGLSLPILPTNVEPTDSTLDLDAETLAQFEALLPETAQPAWQRLLDAPEAVGLVAYQVGDEANGVYWNADVQMPLASVSKLIHLVAYAEAVAAGQLDPTSTVLLADLERYYLPNYDLGAHKRALAELDVQERLLRNPDRVQLQDVPWMMTRFSSNASTDYLQMLLGQARIEQTAVVLNLTTQTAPCPWLGQFMAMGNHTRQAASDRQAVLDYIDNPAAYGAEVALLTDAYSNNVAFREEENRWHAQTRRPSVETQSLFAEQLNAHGSPQEYADLMARIAQNGLSNGESSFLVRRYLEWPMIFPENQEIFNNLGYKNGALPGILTTVYYAYRQGEEAPLVVALFYKDVPPRTYRQWRRNLWPDDELARWILAEPEAIPLLEALLN